MDPTTILISIGAFAGGYAIISWIFRLAAEQKKPPYNGNTTGSDDAASSQGQDEAVWDEPDSVSSVPPPQSKDDALRTLGLARGATADQIRRAYRNLLTQYHPDKVAHLGDELQRLARAKTTVIIQAFQYLKAHYRL